MTSDDHLRQTLAELTDHLRDSVTQEIQNVATTIAGWQDLWIGELVDGRARLVDAVHAIDRARTLGEILDTLTTTAAREAPRVAVLLVREGRASYWKAAGFGDLARDAFESPLGRNEVDDMIGAVVRDRAPVIRSSSSFPALPPFAGETVVGAFAAPLTVGEEVVAVLYADYVDATAPETVSTAWTALDVLARFASRALEAVTAFRLSQLLARERASLRLRSQGWAR